MIRLEGGLGGGGNEFFRFINLVFGKRIYFLRQMSCRVFHECETSPILPGAIVLYIIVALKLENTENWSISFLINIFLTISSLAK